MKCFNWFTSRREAIKFEVGEITYAITLTFFFIGILFFQSMLNICTFLPILG